MLRILNNKFSNIDNGNSNVYDDDANMDNDDANMDCDDYIVSEDSRRREEAVDSPPAPNFTHVERYPPLPRLPPSPVQDDRSGQEASPTPQIYPESNVVTFLEVATSLAKDIAWDKDSLLNFAGCLHREGKGLMVESKLVPPEDCYRALECTGSRQVYFFQHGDGSIS